MYWDSKQFFFHGISLFNDRGVVEIFTFVQENRLRLLFSSLFKNDACVSHEAIVGEREKAHVPFSQASTKVN